MAHWLFALPERGKPAFYTQIDAVIGLGPSLRLGFNPGELLDFFLGWFSLDIYGDDIAMKAWLETKDKKEYEKQSTVTFRGHAGVDTSVIVGTSL